MAYMEGELGNDRGSENLWGKKELLNGGRVFFLFLCRAAFDAT